MAAQEQIKNTSPLQAAKTLVDQTAEAISGLVHSGKLLLPSNYSVENALKSAWLTLQEVKDKNQKPALEVCTKASIVNALMDMAVQGLNPAKKQCYFIVYGNQLTMQRSYFGDVSIVTERIIPGSEVFAACVYEGDELEYEIVRGQRRVTKHVQKLENVAPGSITAAYAGVVNADGEYVNFVLMPWDQIERSWSMSKTYTYNEQNNKEGTHQKFTEDMCERTVKRKVCKTIINNSSDRMLLESIQRQEEFATVIDVEARAAAEANTLALEFDESTVIPGIPSGSNEPEKEPVHVNMGEEPADTKPAEKGKEDLGF